MFVRSICPVSYVYKIDESTLINPYSIKDLGIILDSKLIFIPNITNRTLDDKIY